MFANLLLVLLGVCYCSRESSQSLLGRPRLWGPSEAVVGDIVNFWCAVSEYPKNESILLKLFKTNNREKFLGDYTSLHGKPAKFLIVVRTYHEGNLECQAKAQNNSDIVPTVSDTHYFTVIVKPKGAEVVVNSLSPELFEGTDLELHCEVTAGNHLSYSWMLNGQLLSESPHYHFEEEELWIDRATPEDSGYYMCVATNYFNNTAFNSTSPEIFITFKELVSDPDVSFTVSKNDSHTYQALITCESTKGDMPVTFSLYNGTELIGSMTVEERRATFRVPLDFDRHLGWLQCQANNGDMTTYSSWIPLEVVKVGGPVILHYEYDIGENYAVTYLRFYCMVSKGSHPRYQWFLNKTLLSETGSFYYMYDQPQYGSILMLHVMSSSSGTYHCEVSDSFDNTTAISSKRWHLDKDGLNRLPLLMVAVVFGCFTFLVLLVTACCVVGVRFRKRQFGKQSISSFEMRKTVAVHEDDLGFSEYNEDAGVAESARGDEFDLASEDSVDEWPQIVKERRTLEDEALDALM